MDGEYVDSTLWESADAAIGPAELLLERFLLQRNDETEGASGIEASRGFGCRSRSHIEEAMALFRTDALPISLSHIKDRRSDSTRNLVLEIAITSWAAPIRCEEMWCKFSQPSVSISARPSNIAEYLLQRILQHDQ